MSGAKVIWTASTSGKCHVGFDTPSANYTNRYIRADAPELVALVTQVRDCIETNGEFQTQWERDAIAALAAYEALTKGDAK